MQESGHRRMIDCHCHLSFLQDSQVQSIVDQSPLAKQWIMAGYDPKDWQRQLQIKSQFPKQTMTGEGLHPWFVTSPDFDLQTAMEAFATYWPQADWVGELGLDYSKSKAQRNLQLQALEGQLSQVADQKPLVLHVVQAHADMLSLLEQTSGSGFVHGFTGSAEVAHRYKEAGFLLSFGPGILKSHFKKARAALESLPLDAILIESDSPAGPSAEGSCGAETNDVYDQVLKEVALIKKIDVNTLEEQIVKNIKGLLGG